MNGSVLSAATKGSKAMTKSVWIIISIATVVGGVLAAVIKAIWFRVPYMHESITIRNGAVRHDRTGDPVIKTSGWRCQQAPRDHQVLVNCEQMTSHLAVQNIMVDDEKYELNLTVVSHVLNRRDGIQFKHHPIRTLVVNDLNQYREEVCRDAVRFVMSTSKKAPSQWDSKDLKRAMKRQVKKKLEDVGLSFDDVMLPNVSKSEAQVQGDLIKQAGQLIKDGMLRIESPEFLDEQPAPPDLAVVPS